MLGSRDLKEIANSKERQKQLYKRTMVVVLLSQTLEGAGLVAGITVGALLAKEMLGTVAGPNLVAPSILQPWKPVQKHKVRLMLE